MLTTADHDRNSAGLTYVYPVISRRSSGLSIGINLNPNNACNWQCIYCQVPNLVRGSAPDIDLQQLKYELESFLDYVIHGCFYEQHGIEQSLRTIQDIAISGNGEPTSAANFDQIIELICQSIRQFDLQTKIKLVLITNGSLIHKKAVKSALEKMNLSNSEVWFKLDSATASGIKSINSAGLSIQRVRQNLAISATACPTWLQTCVFKLDGVAPSISERTAYLQFLSSLRTDDIKLQGILLYGLARPSMHAEAKRLSALSLEWIKQYSDEIMRSSGLPVKSFV